MTKKRLAATFTAAIALAGAAASTAFAETGAQGDQTLSFYNQAAGGMLDVYCGGPQGPATWQVVPDDGCQQWKVDIGTEGSLLESIARPGLCVTAPAVLEGEPTNQPCNPSNPAQQWNFPENGSQAYISEASDDQYVLAATATGNLQPLQLQLKSGSPWQQWEANPPA